MSYLGRPTGANRSPRPLSLRAKIRRLVVLNALLVLALAMGGSTWVMVQTHFHEKGEEALNVAETVASMPQVIAAFHQSNPALVIQPLAEEVRQKTGAEFVVVGNMQLIRYSHPNPQMIGKTMVGNDDDWVLRGEPSVTRAVGTLGLSVRGKAPIFDVNHQQIGVVSVGYLVDNIWREILTALLKLAALCAGGVALSLLGAHLLATHIKREIFDMEPAEIAFLTQEQAAILEAIREGIVAVDEQGRVVACNRQAKRLLGLEPQEVLGKPLATAVPHGRLRELLEVGPSGMDQPMVVGNALVVAHRVPVLLHGRPIGAVATFRDKVELDQLDRRLADVERYAEALRSQRHEFMNRLHTIAGLLQLGEYESARELIQRVHHEQQEILDFFIHRVKDPAIVGILVGKLHAAREQGVRLMVDRESWVTDPCPHREAVVTILGNAIDNAIEALSGWDNRPDHPQVRVLVCDGQGELLIRVADNGPGIDPRLGDRVFMDGVSSKGPGRGYGLALVSQVVAHAGGRLAIESSAQGAVLEARLPLSPGRPDQVTADLAAPGPVGPSPRGQTHPGDMACAGPKTKEG